MVIYKGANLIKARIPNLLFLLLVNSCSGEPKLLEFLAEGFQNVDLAESMDGRCDERLAEAEGNETLGVTDELRVVGLVHHWKGVSEICD